MKRLTCLLSLLFAILTATAQVGEYRKDLAVGFSGGYVLNKVSFNPTILQSFHGGCTFGATVRYTCEKYFGIICAIQAEFDFTQLGWKEKIETSSDTYERTVNYFHIPAFARIGFGRERKGVQGYVLIGPQIGFCIGDSETPASATLKRAAENGRKKRWTNVPTTWSSNTICPFRRNLNTVYAADWASK